MRVARPAHGGQSFHAIRIDADGAAVMTRAQVRVLEAATGERSEYWAAIVSTPYRADTYAVAGPWVDADCPPDDAPTPDDGRTWGGATYGAHRAFLAAHAEAYAAHATYAAEDAPAYGHAYALAYGSDALEDARDHSRAFPDWAAGGTP